MIKIHPITGEITIEYVVGETSTQFMLGTHSSIKTADTGIYEEAAYGFNTYNIKGSIKGGSDWLEAAIQINGDSSHIVVAKSGSLSGYIGASINNSYETIVNHGHVHGSGYGLFMTGYSTAENSGAISGEYGIMTGDKSVAVTNDVGGVISGTNIAVNFGGLDTHNSLLNLGLIKGGTEHAISGYDGVETITNRGTIKGDITLKGGNDIFDNRHGKVDHAISGGTGNDTLVVDNATTKLHELTGEGVDTVKSTVSYKLSSNVENLALLGQQDVNATGNDGANVLTGNSGANTLVGKGGEDILKGLRGNDILRGGSGADLFLFADKTGHDVITDFRHGEDHIDVSALSSFNDFDKMMAHHVTVSGDNLVIHSHNDTITLEHVAKSDLDFHDFFY